jgi:hypothetical protein
MRLPGKAAALLAFAVPLAVYLATGALFLADSMPNAYVPVSLLNDGDVVFSPVEAPLLFVWKERRPEGTALVDVQSWSQQGVAGTFADELRDGRLELLSPRYFLVPTLRKRASTGDPLFADAFGPAAGLAALPTAFVAAKLGADLGDPFVVFRVAKWTAGLLTAGSVAMVFLTALRFLTRARALLLAALYAFGTCIWTISSQALWQQTAEIFFLSVGVMCMLRGQGAWLRGGAAGLAYSAAAASRPTAALVMLIAAAFLYWQHRRAFAAFVVASLPAACAVSAYNLHYFGAPLEFGQLAAGAAVAQWKTGSPEVWQTPLWLGAAGLLLSPGRGLLVYTPFLAAAFAGAFIAWRDARFAALRFLTIAVPLLWLPAFAWFDWWGGWAYGYRPIIDTTPLLAVLCIPAIDAMRRPALKAAFVVAAAWSVFVQVLGVTAYTPGGWNGQQADGTPANIDLPEYRDRLWSFRDWQIGYLVAQIGRPQQR